MGKYSDELDREMEENQKKVQEANKKAIEEAQKQALAYQQQIMEMQKQAAAAGGMTPEMMLQMQQQTMQMQQQMMGAMGGYGEEDDEDDDEEDNEEAKAEFTAAHPQPEDKSKYLALGSFFIAMKDEPVGTLEMMWEVEDYKDEMAHSWKVEDRESLMEMIESLLGGRAYKVYNDTYLALKAEEESEEGEVNEDDLASFMTTLEVLEEILEMHEGEIVKCPSIIGWDIERAAYMARTGAHTGYITQEEAWNYLKRAAALTKENFADWTQYAISIAMGRALHMGYTEVYYYPIAELLKESPEFLEERPVKSL